VALGLKVSEILDLDYTPDYKFVDLYINDEYLGIYQLIETVEKGSDRINITDSGFITEISQYDDKEKKFNSSQGILYNFKYPDEDDITDEQILEVKDCIDAFETTLFSPDAEAFSATSGYRKYIDVEEWAKWFLVQNITTNIDTNKYLYKEDNTSSTKIKIGPVWDFEWSNGIGWYDGARPCPSHELMINLGYYNRLLQDPYFKSVVKSIWETVKTSLTTTLVTFLNDSADEMKNSIDRNFEKWDILNERVSVGGIPLGTFDAELECDIQYLTSQITFLDTTFSAW